MSRVYSSPLIKHFFLEIYNLLKDTDSAVTEIWFEISEIEFFKDFSDFELRDFLDKFDFISIQKGNYVHYIVVNKIVFITRCLQFLELDVNHLSYLLNSDGFEALIKDFSAFFIMFSIISLTLSIE